MWNLIWFITFSVIRPENFQNHLKHVLGQEVCPASEQQPNQQNEKLSLHSQYGASNHSPDGAEDDDQGADHMRLGPHERQSALRASAQHPAAKFRWRRRQRHSATFCRFGKVPGNVYSWPIIPKHCPVFILPPPRFSLVDGRDFSRYCASFDFQPGSRIATFSGDPQYEESTCYMTAEQSKPEGLGTLILAPNSIHFTEICITCMSFRFHVI